MSGSASKQAIELLKEKLNNNRYDHFREARQKRRRERLIKIASIAFGAAATLAIALSHTPELNPYYLREIALILSALVTVFSAWSTLNSDEATWVAQEGLAKDLTAILYEVEFAESNGECTPFTCEKLQEFWNRMRDVFDKYNQVQIENGANRGQDGSTGGGAPVSA